MKGCFPMVLCKEFCRIINKIRNDRNLTIAQMCDGIISERTYYRYLHSNSEMSFEVFSKLAQRLSVDTVEVVKYAFYFNKKDPGITRFIFRLQTKCFNDIEPIYESICNYHEKNPSLRKLLNICIKKYQFNIGKVSKSEYISTLKKNVKFSCPNETEDIFTLFARVLYFETVPANPHYSADSLARVFLKVDFRMSAMFYIVALDCLIYSIIGTKSIDEGLFRLLVTHFEKVLEFVDIKPFHMQRTLYRAYTHFLDSEKNEMEHFLFLYAINLSVLMGGENYRAAKSKVEVLFHIDVDDFIKVQSKNLAIPMHFAIE